MRQGAISEILKGSELNFLGTISRNGLGLILSVPPKTDDAGVYNDSLCSTIVCKLFSLHLIHVGFHYFRPA